MDQQTKQQIASRFCVISSFGDSICPNANHLSVKPINKTSRVRAEVSSIGSWLRVNTNTFPNDEVETRIITYIHEAGHLGNDYHHKPDFWETVATIANKILSSEQNKAVIQSQFAKDIDWHKVRYRLIQDVSEECVDGRCETVEERQRLFANSLNGYDKETAEYFDLKRYSWWVGDIDDPIPNGEYTVNVTPAKQGSTADGIDDSEFNSFVEEYGVKQDEDHISFVAPVTYSNGSNQQFIDYEYANIMMAFCDRIGMSYSPMTKSEAVVEEVTKIRDDSDEIKRICENQASI